MLHQLRRRAAVALASLAAVLAGNVEEMQVIVALALIGYGMSLVWMPGAYLVPGVVWLWLWLPQRKPLIAPTPAAPVETKGRS